VNFFKWIEDYWKPEFHSYYNADPDDIEIAKKAFEEFLEEEVGYKLKPKFMSFIQHPKFPLTNADYAIIVELFMNLPWDQAPEDYDDEEAKQFSMSYGCYGGPKWAEIAKWTQQLQNDGPIENNPFSVVTYNKIKKLSLDIDVLHSLEHNTKMVLNNLGNKEYKWMQEALDNVKNLDPVDVVKKSKNKHLIKLFR